MPSTDTKSVVSLEVLSYLEKRLSNVLKMSQSDICSVTSVGRPQDVNLIIIHKVGFEENISLYFLVASVYQTLNSQNKFKNLARPILALSWSETSPLK